MKKQVKKNKKVILILVDGMRSDAVEKCGHPFIEEVKKKIYRKLQVQVGHPHGKN